MNVVLLMVLGFVMVCSMFDDKQYIETRDGEDKILVVESISEEEYQKLLKSKPVSYTHLTLPTN